MMLKLSDGNTKVSYTNSLYLHIYVKFLTVRILKSNHNLKLQLISLHLPHCRETWYSGSYLAWSFPRRPANRAESSPRTHLLLLCFHSRPGDASMGSRLFHNFAANLFTALLIGHKAILP